MRLLIIVFSICMMNIKLPAQSKVFIPAEKDRYKQVSGRYGGNEGVCLFEDSTFMLYGYATAIFGKYVFEKEHILFYTDKPFLFDVYAHHNKSIGNNTRMNFVGFEDGGKTYIQLGNDSVQRVFNDDANCFSSPYVHEQKGILSTFTVFNVPYDAEFIETFPGNWYYENKEQYNDFILVHNPLKREQRDFAASFYISKSKQIHLALTNYGGEEGYRKQPITEHEKKQWKEILEMKEEYYRTKAMNETTLLANTHYNVFYKELEGYKLDAATNQYIADNAADNEAYFRSDEYRDDRYLRKYVKLQPNLKSSTPLEQDKVSTTSIFFTACGEDADKSYQYKGFKYKKEEE